MKTKSEILYELMLRKGYPEAFSKLICSEMNTDFMAEKMIKYIGREKHRLEDVADEMIAIREFRDRMIDKHITEHAQASINKLYREINE